MDNSNIPEVPTSLDSAFEPVSDQVVPDSAADPSPVEPEKANIPPIIPPMDPASREAVLLLREQAIALRERRFNAREQLLAQRLPLDLLEHFDFSSDDSVKRALALAVMASSASRGAPGSPVPPAFVPSSPVPSSYADRVRLWQIDPQGYKSMVADSLKN